MYHIDASSLPLLIGQGVNDPRVKQVDADQISFTMQKKDIPVECVLYPNESHRFARPDNRIDFNDRAELFPATHLSGRAEVFQTPPGSNTWFPLLEEPAALKEPEEESHLVWKLTAANEK